MEFQQRLLDHVGPLIDAALAEDVGSGDVTTESTVAADARAEGVIRAKQWGVISGLSVAQGVFERIDPEVQFEADVMDGDRVEPGMIVARVSGSARSLLVAERVALNFLQFLSGIATAVAAGVRVLEGTRTQILDTRKTLPTMRLLSKYAVQCGGGENHRYGLYDMILIKENHIAAAGGIAQAIRGAREQHPQLTLEIEVRNMEELETALAEKPDRIMLDNFTPRQIRQAMDRVESMDRRPQIEASGGITLENLREYGATGVDFVSLGAITHSAPALDLSMTITPVEPAGS